MARAARGFRDGVRSAPPRRSFGRAGEERALCGLGRALQAYAATDELDAEFDYWLDRGSQAAFPCDDAHGGVDRVADGEEISLAFDAGLTTRLLKEAPSAYRTQVNDLLLAALARAVSRWSGIEDVVVELEGHGREDVFAVRTCHAPLAGSPRPFRFVCRAAQGMTPR
ncbi:condensation domain-containing protein [Bradyrhizobium sp. 1(2017)]